MPDKSTKNYIVAGLIKNQHGAPLANVTVKAFDRDLRREQLLGEARSDGLGGYQITYAASQFRQAEKTNADLIIKAFAEDGSILAESPILFNAPTNAEVNLTVVDDTPLFEKIEREIRPLLENLKIEELEENDKHHDLTFLTGETGIEKRDLARFVLAYRLARRGIEPEFWFAVLGGSFYRYSESQTLADQLNDVLERLPALDAGFIGKALKSAFNLNEISRRFEDKADRWVSAFLRFAAEQTVSESGAPTFARSALDEAGIRDAKKREKFARLHNQHGTLNAQMLKALERDKSFKPKEIADLRTSFELRELTQTDFSVVKAIKDEFGIRRPEQIRTLAKKSEKEWMSMVTSKRVKTPFFENKLSMGRTKALEPEIFAKTLERQFREAYPTAAFAGGLDRALKSKGSRGLRHAETLGKFLDRHESFELLNTPVDDFLKNSVQPAFRNVASDESFRLEVKAVQRVFKLAPTFEATDALLADDLHSAQQIYRIGESEFVRRYEGRPGFTTESARSAWNRAADTHAAVLTVVADLKALEPDTLPKALGFDAQALAGFPNWNNLFQTGDMCDCGHCRSVLSPAAYYADVLMFLKDRPAKNPSRFVKDILFDRRPDLGFLELNCENALTTLPYVDVVCEVLEDAVDEAAENDLVLAGLTAIPANAAAAKIAVANAFENAFQAPANDGKQKIGLGADFSLSQVYPPPGPPPPNPNLWVVHGDDATYLLRKKASPNFRAKILRNTKTTADELRAFPQYVNPKAYEKLRAARYPMALPFDLFAEEVRASFQKTNLQRWDLMQTLRGTAAPTEGDIAAEYFGISAGSEREIILQANPSVANQRILWGEAGPNWLNRVRNVKTFLLKTGLEYNDLLAMLDLEFINPAGNITVQHLDDSCDTDQKVIQGLGAARLDRIHRFLRLWRKLTGWKMWELDLVIRHPAIGGGTLDETFLINLLYFVRLQKRLGKKATVEQTCALFDDLNIETRFTELHEKRENALYHDLFLNKRFINPLDPTFEIDATTGDLPVGETITDHHPTILAALRVREADLVLLKALTKASDGTAYIPDVLDRANLSFLWRHAWLSKLLKIKAEDWKILLKLLQQDLAVFFDPKAAFQFVEQIDKLKSSGFGIDELNWLLAADRTAKSAVKESDAARFLAGLRKELQLIQTEHDPTQYEFLAAVPPTDTDSLTALLTSLLQKLNRTESEITSFLKALSGELLLEAPVSGLPLGFVFPATVTGPPGNIPVQYNEETGMLHFVGLMSDAQRITLLGVDGAAGYQTAVEALFEQSQSARLGVKFFENIFTSALAALPSAIDFKAQLNAELAAKISYDVEQHLLRFAGVMTEAERDLLNALAPSVLPDEIAYHNAVNDLATQPQVIAPADERVWMSDNDLDATLPASDTYPKRLANAVTKALTYLSRTLSKGVVVQQSSAQLGLTEALTRRLLTDYAILPDSLLTHLTNVFAATTGVVDYATLKPTFDGWYWANRVAAIWKKWKVNFAELDRIISITAAAQIVDFSTLPLDDTQPIVSAELFARTHGLIRLRDTLPETSITFFEVLEKLNAGAYASEADFAADVELLNEAWLAADVEAIVDSLDLNYPNDYLLAESWERLRRAFYFLDSLNASAATAIMFASAAMSETHRQTIRELLLSKFGDETWAVLSTEIQDVLRERKRDSLVAYLLSLPKPSDAPSGKWENANDLYAYYLLDVEMSSCQLTSRLVQGSGSLQLFVQRCFMGLEPKVVVTADGTESESAWRWWEWMRKYRVWEANRKVFLWPENWIEPELKADRSSFFKDLENELLQNEVNQYTVEAAFQSYLEKLDGVAQLEIAGFYQEDDGDLAIVHVFGRTKGADPHLYYYRTYDYHQWSPWEKVDLDIQGNYLIPAVVNKRLFLFWPVFTEIPDEESNNAAVPMPGGKMTQDGENSQKIEMDDAPVKKAKKKLRLQMAVSDYRNGIWSPKKVSTDFEESGPYEGDIIRKHYRFYPIDRSEIDGRFGIRFEGSSATSGNTATAGLLGTFEIANCKGVPALTNDLSGSFVHIVRPEQAATGEKTVFHKWAELGPPESGRSDYPENDFTLVSLATNQLKRLLTWTPWRFKMSPPWHLSYLDKLFYDGVSLFSAFSERGVPLGSWLPFFYNDKKRTFFVLPVNKTYQRDPRPSIVGSPADGGGSIAYYYPDIKKFIRAIENAIAGFYQTWLDGIDFSGWSPGARQALEQLLYQGVPAEFPPPYTDEQLKELLKRYLMRFVHFYLGSMALQSIQNSRYHFKNYYHPFVCDFAKLLYNPLEGIPALMSRETQLKDSGFSFRQHYVPTPAVIETSTEEYYPKENVDFSPDGAYSQYNWELFFHAPLLIANSLSKNQRFEEAREWYHFIFNPLGVESPVPGGSIMSKYWITKPFFETTDPEYVQQRIENIMRMLAGDTSIPGYSPQAKKDLEDQVLDWRTNPFEPHRIANYRTVAYQKTVVMKYLDNLIAWGDYLFRQDSMESINEATQLYILAAEILGERPRKVPPRAEPRVQSFNELEHEFDKFSNALVEVENLVPPLPGEGSGGSSAPLPMLYFCIPRNDKMLGYWDTVADRLYKIRHCMNIEGVVRQLALFEPPIDPGALVKAVAGGMSLSDALADLNAPLPLYRFNVLLQKANEVCNDVKALGAALLAALEKKDAEALSQLRQKQEIILLEAIKAVREQQIEEAKINLKGIKESKELAKLKKKYYESRDYMNPGEIVAISLSGASTAIDTGVAVGYALAGGLRAVPEFLIGAAGFGGSPEAGAETGGKTFGSIAEDAALTLTAISRALEKGASIATTVASYERRQDDWDFQRDLAIKEIEQIEETIAAAELRIKIAEKELENQIIQIEHSKATDEFMRSKYTNKDLYQWHIGQISGVYFQSYKLAYDLAKRAERCFRFELGLDQSSYINFGYWDSLKKGLLSGEKLQYDLRRLESAHIEKNRREFELTKHVSLATLDPLALLKLRETGRCFLRLPEEIFDLDYPGHYFRRIKSVSITLPCVAGPYTTISCTLRLLKNSIRTKTTNGDNGYPRNTDDNGLPADDERFVENNIPVKAIAASGGQNDSGMFELSFRDERYLPFEGAGAVSEWSLELFTDSPAPDFGKPLRQFDYNSISDAVVHLKYTAREDGGPFKNGAITHLRSYFEGEVPTPSLRMFNLRQEFPTEWHRFLNPADPADGNVLELEIDHARFPFRDANKTLTINRLWLLARCTDEQDHEVEVTAPLAEPLELFVLAQSDQFGRLHFSMKDDVAVDIAPTDVSFNWRFKMTGPNPENLQMDDVENMILVLGYQWTTP